MEPMKGTKDAASLRQTLRRVEATAENLSRVASILYECFKEDPVINFMVFAAPAGRREKLRRDIWFQALVKAASKNGAEFYEVADWSGVSIWMPPGKAVDNPMTLIPSGILTLLWNMGIKGLYRMFWCFGHQVSVALSTHVQNRPHWYCFFVAVLPSAQGRGLSRFLMEPHSPSLNHLAENHASVKVKGGEGPVPVWLEATTAKSQKIYERFGWKVVDQIWLGAETVDETGANQSGGSGVPVWCMTCD